MDTRRYGDGVSVVEVRVTRERPGVGVGCRKDEVPRTGPITWSGTLWETEEKRPPKEGRAESPPRSPSDQDT